MWNIQDFIIQTKKSYKSENKISDIQQQKPFYVTNIFSVTDVDRNKFVHSDGFSVVSVTISESVSLSHLQVQLFVRSDSQTDPHV